MLRMKIKISEQLELTSQIQITCRSPKKRVNRSANAPGLKRLCQVFTRALNLQPIPAARPEQIWLLEHSRQVRS